MRRGGISVAAGLLALAPALSIPLQSSGQQSGAPLKKGPLKIFLMAGQSNMEGHAALPTIDFLGEDPDPARAALLKKFKPDGKTLVSRDDVWVVSGSWGAGSTFDKLQPGLELLLAKYVYGGGSRRLALRSF